MRSFILFTIIMLLIGLLLALLFKHFPESMKSDQNKMALVFSVIVITSMVAKISNSNIKLGILLKQISGWIVISLLILTGYSYQFELKQLGNRLSATIIPGYGQGNGDGSVTFYAGNNGHFSVTALLNLIT